MKFVMDERLKHRLVGLLVVLSIAAIFVPAIVKKSNQRLDGKNLDVASIHLPKNPPQPLVVVPTQAALFKRLRVAHVDLAKTSQESPLSQPLATISKAERLSAPSIPDKMAVKLAVAEPIKTSSIPSLKIKNTATAAVSPVSQLIALKAVSNKPIVQPRYKFQSKPKPIQARNNTLPRTSFTKITNIKNSTYAIQLGIFTEKSNALALLNKLKKIGFNAHFIEVPVRNTKTYKVLVGDLRNKQDALQLQRQLAHATKLEGFIVPTTRTG